MNRPYLALALAAVLAAPAVHADNFFGGRIVDDTTLRVGAGFPQVEVGATFNVAVPELDISPRLSLAFGRDMAVACCHVELAGDVRYEVYRDGPLTGALMLSLPVGIDTTGPYVSVGVLWPGFALTFSAGTDIDIDFGVQLQSSLLFETATVLQLWADAFVGLSYAVTPSFSIGFRADVGPDIYAGSVIHRNGRVYFDSFVDFNMRLMIAAGFEL